MFIVTGANGRLGRAIVHELLERMPAERVGATCRDTDKASDLAALGVRIRHGDFVDPVSLPRAFEGARRVLIVSSNAAAYGGDPLAQHRAAIEACRAVGVERVLYTSHMAASERSAFAPMRDHHATEAMLRDSGLGWVALRNGFYAASGIAFLGDAFTTGVVQAPADGKVMWTAHGDLAEAAARILVSDDTADGPTPPLVATEGLDLADLASIVAQRTGRPCRRSVLSDDAMRRTLAARGVPDRAIELALGFYVASRNGEFTSTGDALSKLLGRPPISMREAIATHLDASPGQ